MAATPYKIADLSYIKGLTGNSWTPTGRTSLVCPKYGDISSHEPQLTINRLSSTTNSRLIKESDIVAMDLCYHTNISEGRVSFDDGYLTLSENYGFTLEIQFMVNVFNTWDEAGLIFSTYSTNTQDALGLRIEDYGLPNNYRFGAFVKNSSSSNQYVYWGPFKQGDIRHTRITVIYTKQVGSKNINVKFSGIYGSATETLTPTTTNWSSYKTTYFYIGKHPQYSQFQADVTVSSISLVKNFI